MSLDIGGAFRQGVSRTFSRNGLALAAVFAAIALVTVVLTHTLMVAALDSMLQFFQDFSPEELDVSQQEYEEMLTELEMAHDEASAFAPLAVAGIPASAAAGGLLLTALLAEATSIVAVRVFAAEDSDAVSRDVITDNILLATLNGFIGGIVVWALIVLGLFLFVLPGIFLAVAFFFLRQEIALKDKNFVQAMADSWRLTKGYRIEVFLVGFLVVLISLADVFTGGIVGFVSEAAGEVVASLLGGLLAAFGAAVVTRTYVQIDEEDVAAPDDDGEAEDPYAKALGPDDIPE